jgi:hypothetical protein
MTLGSLFNEFLCKLGFIWLDWAYECQKKPNLHTNQLNIKFSSTSLLKAPNRLKSLKLAWRFVLTSCDIYQNPFTQEKIFKFWQCRNKKTLRPGCIKLS